MIKNKSRSIQLYRYAYQPVNVALNLKNLIKWQSRFFSAPSQLFRGTCLNKLKNIKAYGQTRLPGNLLPNGYISDISNFIATGANFSLRGISGYITPSSGSYIDLVSDSTIPAYAKDNQNAIKIVLNSAQAAAEAQIYSTHTHYLKPNTRYRFSCWVKTNELYGLKFMVYEPNYINRLNNTAYSATSIIGQNTYGYSFTTGKDSSNPPFWNHRVVRNDIPYRATANSQPADNNYIGGITDSTCAYTRGATPAEIQAGLADSRGYYEVSKKFGANTNGWVRLSIEFTTKSGFWNSAAARTDIDPNGNGLTDIIYDVPVSLSLVVALQSGRVSTLWFGGFEIKEGDDIELQSSTPKPDLPLPIRESGNLNILVQSQNSPLPAKSYSLPVALRGIKLSPNTANYNFADQNGERWVCDLLDWQQKKLMQNVGKIVFDGSENWEQVSAGFYTLPHLFAGGSAGLCTHFSCGNPMFVDIYGGFYLNPTPNGYSPIFAMYSLKTLSEWRDWLAAQAEAGTPVEFYYQLKNPIERHIDLPDITLLPKSSAITSTARLSAEALTMD